MKILGECFFDMLTQRVATFSIPSVETVVVQPVQISIVDEDTMSIVREDELHLCIVTTTDGKFLSTSPDLPQSKVIQIAEIVGDMCKKYHASKFN